MSPLALFFIKVQVSTINNIPKLINHNEEGLAIKSIKDIESRLRLGADKISINQQAMNKPTFIEEAAKEFGSQCIVVSIDIKMKDDNYAIYNHSQDNCYNIDLINYLIEKLIIFIEKYEDDFKKQSYQFSIKVSGDTFIIKAEHKRACRFMFSFNSALISSGSRPNVSRDTLI